MTCPEGFQCPDKATIEPEMCHEGYYSDENQTTCTECEIGYACPTPFKNDRF